MRFDRSRKSFRIPVFVFILMLYQIAAALFALMYDSAYTNQYEYYRSLGDYHLTVGDLSAEQYEKLLGMSERYRFSVRDAAKDGAWAHITLEEASKSAYKSFVGNVMAGLGKSDGGHEPVVAKSRLFNFVSMYEIPYMGYLLGYGLMIVAGIAAVCFCAYMDPAAPLTYRDIVKYGIPLIVPSDIAALIIYAAIQLTGGSKIYISMLTPLAAVLCQAVMVFILGAAYRIAASKRENGCSDEDDDHPAVRVILCTLSVFAISVVFVYTYSLSVGTTDLSDGANYFSVGVGSPDLTAIDPEILDRFGDIPGIDYVIGQTSYVSHGVNECVIIDADAVIDDDSRLRDINGSTETVISDFFLSPTDEQRLVLLSKYAYEGDIQSVIGSDISVIVNNNVRNHPKYRLGVGDQIDVAVRNDDGRYSIHSFTVGAVLTDHPTTDLFEIYLSDSAYEAVVGKRAALTDVYLGSLRELPDGEVERIETEIWRIIGPDILDYNVVNLNDLRAYTDKIDDMTIPVVILIIIVLTVMASVAANRLSVGNLIYMAVANVLINSIVLSPIVFGIANRYPVYKRYSYPISDILTNLILMILISGGMYLFGLMLRERRD